MVSVGEVDVVLVEDGGPLERCGVLGLASSAMAQLGVKRLLSAQLVLDLATVAAGLVSSLEVLVGLVDLVRSTLLPILDWLLGLLALCFAGIHGLFFLLETA